MPRLLLTAALVISGGAALIYETIWTRQLGLLMGHTVAAATCVLAASCSGWRRARRRWTHRRAVLADVGAARGRGPRNAHRRPGAVLPVEIAGLHPLLGWAYGDVGGPAFAVTRFVTALIVVLLPAWRWERHCRWSCVGPSVPGPGGT